MADYLTADEERELARRRDAGLEALALLEDDDLDATRTPGERRGLYDRMEAGQAARDELVMRNLRLVYWATRPQRDAAFAVGMDLDDVIQSGFLGLIDAAERFDPEAARFTTFAKYRIRLAVQVEIRRGGLIRVSTRTMEAMAAAQLGAGPADAEKAAMVEAGRAAIRARAAGQAAGHDLLEAVEAPDREPDEGRDRAGAVEDLLRVLPPRDRLVVSLRFGLGPEQPRTLREVGESVGLTKQRAGQIESRAMSRLRRAAAERGMEVSSWA